MGYKKFLGIGYKKFLGMGYKKFLWPGSLEWVTRNSWEKLLTFSPDFPVKDSWEFPRIPRKDSWEFLRIFSKIVTWGLNFFANSLKNLSGNLKSRGHFPKSKIWGCSIKAFITSFLQRTTICKYLYLYMDVCNTIFNPIYV